MRTTKALLCAAAVAAGAISAMAQSNVYSLNVVGYINVTVPAGGFVATANPFDNGTGNYMSNVLSSVPVTTTKAWFWDRASSQYGNYTYRASGWGLGAGVQINPGTGFFLQNTAATNITVTYVGNVMQGTNNYPYGNGFNLISYMAPISGKVETQLGLPVVNGDKVWQFQPDTQTYGQFTRRTTAWGSGLEPTIGTNAYVGVAESFFLQTAAPNTWTNKFSVQ